MVLIVSWSAVAQFDLEILDPDSNIITGDTYTVYGLPSTSTLSASIRAQNLGPNDITIGIKRYEVGVQSGTENFFGCMGSVDAGSFPLMYDVIGPYQVVAGGSYSIGIYHVPNGLVGISCYQFIWYDHNNPIDSVWANICFDTQSVGVQEYEPSVTCEVYPNPSRGPLNLAITLDGSVSEPRLTVYDGQGRLVWEKALMSPKEKVVINEGELKSGLYMYQIVGNDRTYHAGRFVITD